MLKCMFGGHEDVCVVGLCVVCTRLARDGVKVKAVLVGK